MQKDSENLHKALFKKGTPVREHLEDSRVRHLSKTKGTTNLKELAVPPSPSGDLAKLVLASPAPEKMLMTKTSFLSYLEEILIDPEFQLIDTIMQSTKMEDRSQQEIRSLLLQLFESKSDSAHNATMDLIRFALAESLKTARTLHAEPSTLFRSNCWTTKLISEFMKTKGEGFAQRVLGPIILRLATSNISTEVNPMRIGTEDLAKNQKVVYEMLEDLVKGLFNAFPFFPSVLKDMFAVTAELVKTYYPEHPNLPHKIIAGFLFLRFVNAALVSPWQWRVVPDGLQLSSNVQKGCVYASKFLQTLANGVEATDKETYMKFLDPLLVKHKNEMLHFLDGVSASDGIPDEYPESLKDRRSEILTSLALILSPHIAELKLALSPRNAERLEIAIKGLIVHPTVAPNAPIASAVSTSSTPSSTLSLSKRKALAEVNLPAADENSPTKKRKNSEIGVEKIAPAPETPTKREKPAPLVRGLSELASKGKSLISSRRQSFLGAVSPRTPAAGADGEKRSEKSSNVSSSRRQSLAGRI